MKDRHDKHTPDFFGGGQERKRRKIKQVLDHENERWKAAYLKNAEEYFAGLPFGQSFTAEDVRGYVSRILGPPHHANVWSGVFRSFALPRLTLGWLEETGQYVPAVRRRSNGRMLRLYRKVRPVWKPDR